LIVSNLKKNTIIFAFIIIFSTAIIKYLGGYIASMGIKWNFKERIFVGICYWPKAAI
jgi:hypothetical protein